MLLTRNSILKIVYFNAIPIKIFPTELFMDCDNLISEIFKEGEDLKQSVVKNLFYYVKSIHSFKAVCS